MQYGHRKKTAILRLHVSQMSVLDEINALTDLEDKHEMIKGLKFHTSQVTEH